MNSYKIKWDLLIIIFAVYNCLSLPIELAMVPPFMINKQRYFDITNNLIDILFFFDIIIQFRTTFIHPMTGEEKNNSKEIAINYLTGKFFVDLISTVPLDSKIFMKDVDVKHTKNFVLFSCLKLIRILRLTRIIDYMKSSDDIKIQLKLAKLLFFLVLFIHISGCTWIFVCTIVNDFDDYPDIRLHGCKDQLPYGVWIPPDWQNYALWTSNTRNFYC